MEHTLSKSQNNFYKPLSLTGSSFFNPRKDKTNYFFENSKVGSCSYVLVKNGQTRAIPFRITNWRGRSLNHFKRVPKKLEEVKTIYQKDYLPIPDLHCGMGKKPLMPYDPDSCRSRIATAGAVMGLNNRSYISLGDSNLINRKQWSSCYRDSFRWPRIVPISNPGINSELARQSHMKLNGC